MLKHLTAILLVFAAFTLTTEAQLKHGRKRTPQFLYGFSVGAEVGPNIFMGDLVDGDKLKFSFNLLAEKEFLDYLSVRVGLGGGLLGGSQADDLFFDGTYFNLHVAAHLYPISAFMGYNYTRKFEPYVGLGAGGLFYSADKTSESDPEETLWKNVSASGITFEFHGTVGCHYIINSHWKVFLEGTGFYTFTDLLDAHDGYYVGDTKIEGEWGLDPFATIMVGCSYKFADRGWRTSSKYNRQNYIKNRKNYRKNANRLRRR